MALFKYSTPRQLFNFPSLAYPLSLCSLGIFSLENVLRSSCTYSSISQSGAFHILLQWKLAPLKYLSRAQFSSPLFNFNPECDEYAASSSRKCEWVGELHQIGKCRGTISFVTPIKTSIWGSAEIKGDWIQEKEPQKKQYNGHLEVKRNNKKQVLSCWPSLPPSCLSYLSATISMMDGEGDGDGGDGVDGGDGGRAA